jgi:hypothetical protein
MKRVSIRRNAFIFTPLKEYGKFPLGTSEVPTEKYFLKLHLIFKKNVDHYSSLHWKFQMKPYDPMQRYYSGMSQQIQKCLIK